MSTRLQLSTPPQRIVVIGAGYVGLVTAVGLAGLGHAVTLVESSAARRDALAAGRVPIHEPGLQAAFDAACSAGRLTVDGAAPDAAGDQVMVCVGTPIGNDGRADLSQLQASLTGLPPKLAATAVVVLRSTIPVGMAARIAAWAPVPTSRIFLNPEFLAQGTAYQDFLHPTRIVIGTFDNPDPSAIGRVRDLFAGFEAPVLIVSAADAELIKNVANAFLALRLSFANEVAGLCEAYGADAGRVLEGVGLDPRLGRRYLRPSFGFGGSCLPKELQTLALAGTDRGLPMHVTLAASAANAASQERFAERVDAAVGGVRGRRITVLGLAFKADTDDTRYSPAVAVARALLARGGHVCAFDPAAGENAGRELPDLELATSAEAAVEGAEAVVIATEWPAFAELDWAALRPRMARPVVIDGRRLLDPVRMRSFGYRYLALGTAEPDETQAIGKEA